ncbi:MAG: hypothetical protein IJ866_03315 [Alphaproteobacteria bacterium]|nr:hypothetical protein [Alphaproteobacteria bacterium]
MNYILVADKQEADNIKIPPELEQTTEIIVLGIGCPATLRTLAKLFLNKKFNHGDRFFNIGYVGSNEYPIGTVVNVGVAAAEQNSKHFPCPEYTLDTTSNVKCYSSFDFVESSEHTGIFDMELYTLASLFPTIKSVKIVSDNLNFHDWKSVDISDAWKIANSMLFKIISEQ